MTSIAERLSQDLDAIEALSVEGAYAGMGPYLAQLEAAVDVGAQPLVMRLRAAIEGHDALRVASALADLRTELAARAHRRARSSA